MSLIVARSPDTRRDYFPRRYVPIAVDAPKMAQSDFAPPHRGANHAPAHSAPWTTEEYHRNPGPTPQARNQWVRRPKIATPDANDKTQTPLSAGAPSSHSATACRARFDNRPTHPHQDQIE